jgi:GxxExxY protein
MLQGKHTDLTDRILKAFYTVHHRLGYGFNEKVYENALVMELRKGGLQARPQIPVKVFYDGEVVGEYVADVIVNEVVLLELKAVSKLLDEHEAQLLNYLKATTMEVGLLLNFGPKPEVKRKVYDNERKGSLTWTTRQSSTELPQQPPDPF